MCCRGSAVGGGAGVRGCSYLPFKSRTCRISASHRHHHRTPEFIKLLKTNKYVAAGPVSRILSVLRRDGHSSGPRITAGLKRPTRRLWRAEPARISGVPESSPENPSLFGLAPCGVCPARRITVAAVRSYRTFSPLPEPCGPGGMFSVALSVEPA
jgi:hypothetical protein